MLTGTLGIELATDLSTAAHGATVHYSYAVRFTPDATGPRAASGASILLEDDTCTLVNPVLTRGLNIGDSDSDGNLDAGETWKYACALTVPAHDDAEFNPIVNSVAVSGDDVRGDPALEAADTASVDIVHDQGTLTITQSADVSTATHGSPVTYRFAVSYRAADRVPALGVIVSDPICDADPAFVSGDADQDGQLDVTETWIFQCRHVVLSHSDTEADPMVSVATASGFNFDLVALPDATSNPVPVDIVHDRGTLAILQSADVSKVAHGSSVTYSFQVSYNSADRLPATGVAVSDPRCDAVAALISGDVDQDRRLDVTETWLFQCRHVVPAHSDNEADPMVSVATASGFSFDLADLADVTSNPVSVDIVHGTGTLTILQSADVSSVAHGSSVTYSFQVSYNSVDRMPANGVKVSDPICDAPPALVSGDQNQDGRLDVTENWTFRCMRAVLGHDEAEPRSMMSRATVSALGSDGTPLADAISNAVTVDIVHDAGALSIFQSPDASSVAHGGLVTYTFAVSYRSADGAPAQGVTVSDTTCDAPPSLVSGDEDLDRRLDVTETWTFQCEHAVPGSHNPVEPDPIESIATVSGKDLDGDPLTSRPSNKVSVHLVHGTISGRTFLDSDGDGTQDVDETAVVGWTIKLFRDANGNSVFDAGADTLVGTRLTDAAGSYSFGDLVPGTYFPREVVQAGFVQTTAERRVMVSDGEVLAGQDFGNQTPVVFLITDPWDSSKTALLVLGTVANDKISFSPGPKDRTKPKGAPSAASKGQVPVAVTINGLPRGNFSPTGRIIAYGQAGDDSIDVANGVSLPAVLHGGTGNDMLAGGPSHDVLLGDAGNDQLNGQKGNDLLIGGQGADRLGGGDGNDILIAGYTDFDTRDEALAAIMAQWSSSSSRDYAIRVGNLRGPGNANGSFLLNPSTVHDDAVADMLTGAAGQDWFLARQVGSARDILTGRLAAEFADTI